MTRATDPLGLDRLHLRDRYGVAQTHVPEKYLRVWRLYLVGGALAVRDGRMGVDQILAVRPGAPHDLPAVRGF